MNAKQRKLKKLAIILLAVIADIAETMQVPVDTWMSVMSQSSRNTAIVIWCIAAVVYERKHT